MNEHILGGGNSDERKTQWWGGRDVKMCSGKFERMRRICLLFLCSIKLVVYCICFVIVGVFIYRGGGPHRRTIVDSFVC